MAKKYYLYSMVGALLFTSCYQEIDFKNYDEEAENTLVLNSIVNPDSTVSVVATKVFYYSDAHTEREFVDGLDMELWIDGEFKEKLVYNMQTHYYRSSIHPKEGEKVMVRTRYKGQEIEASDVVPKPVKIESLEMSRQGPMTIYSNKDYKMTYHLTFTDPAGEANYYFLQWDEAPGGGGLYMGERNFESEYVFQELARVISGTIPGWKPYSYYGLPFSDHGIDGQRHRLEVQEIIQESSVQRPLSSYDEMLRNFRLYAISKDYYNYLVSILYNTTDDGLLGGMIDLGVVDPVKVHSNVAGGLGIVVGYALSDTTVDVMQTVGRFPR